jgi:DNA-directed RNA polymerase subunit omega
MELGTRTPKNVIPDDPDQSTYRFIIVAAKRARQLQDGARSLLPGISRKPTVTSMEETRRGLVKYNDPSRADENPEDAGSAPENL